MVCHSLCTYRHNLLEVVQGEGRHADGGFEVTWHNGRGQQLLVDAGGEADVQCDAVVHSQAHELTDEVKFAHLEGFTDPTYTSSLQLHNGCIRNQRQLPHCLMANVLTGSGLYGGTFNTLLFIMSHLMITM